MGVFSALGITKSGDQKRAESRMRSAAAGEGARRERFDTRATGSRNRYLELLEGFDPQSFMQSAAEGVGSELHEGFVDTLGQNNQALNARGFFGSGLNTAKISEDFSNRLSRALAQLSMQTAGLEQNRIGMVGDQGRIDASRADHSRGLELDLYAGDLDAQIADRNAKLAGTIGLARSAGSFFGGR